jgi:hypothetical protein
VLEPKNLKDGDIFYYYTFEYYAIVEKAHASSIDFCWYFMDGNSLGDCPKTTFTNSVWGYCIPATPLLRALC